MAGPKQQLVTEAPSAVDDPTAAAPRRRREDQAPLELPSPKARTRAMEAALSRHAGERLAIFIKGYPDPDSIASAMAHQHLCRSLGVEADIIHFEELSHHENRALVKRLEIEMHPWTAGYDLSGYAGYSCVDTQSPDLPVEVPATMKVVSLVDHHKSIGPIDAEIVDVREDAGSTSAIYCEYLADGSVGLDPALPITIKLATALMHGIRSDTDDFIAARPIDFEASAYLAPFVDRELLQVISEQSISSKSMDILQVALDKKIIRGNYLIAGVGFVRDEDRDGIGEAADYLLRREGVDTVVVYGIVAMEMIDGSLRTSSNTVDPDKWIKDLFGLDPSGRYYGGGRRDKGGFQIPLGIFARCDDKDLVWNTVEHTLEDLFFHKIGAARDEP